MDSNNFVSPGTAKFRFYDGIYNNTMAKWRFPSKASVVSCPRCGARATEPCYSSVKPKDGTVLRRSNIHSERMQAFKRRLDNPPPTGFDAVAYALRRDR